MGREQEVLLRCLNHFFPPILNIRLGLPKGLEQRRFEILRGERKGEGGGGGGTKAFLLPHCLPFPILSSLSPPEATDTHTQTTGPHVFCLETFSIKILILTHSNIHNILGLLYQSLLNVPSG